MWLIYTSLLLMFREEDALITMQILLESTIRDNYQSAFKYYLSF